MKIRSWTIELSLYLLAFLLALSLRFINLNTPPLTDVEAQWALQALGIARGQAVALGPQPGILLLTGLLFFLFHSTNLLARFLPALIGSLLVLAPLPFRRWLGRPAALILAFGLALDPGLASLSRVVGSPIPALSFGLLALAAWAARRPILAGVLAGLALLSGPSILQGALALSLAWIVIEALKALGLADRSPLPLQAEAPEPDQPLTRPSPWRPAAFFLLGAVLLVGTLFFRYPQGLDALAATLPAYFQTWAVPSGVPALRLPLALVVYQPFALIFGLVGLVRSWLPGARMKLNQRPLAQFFSLWALIAFLLAMIYPGRQVSDLVWVLVPLWGLAAIELALDFSAVTDSAGRWVSLGQAILLIILLAFSWMNLAGMSHLTQAEGGPGVTGAILLIVGAIAMATVTTLLVALGWSGDIARQGLVWGLVAGLGIYMIASISFAAPPRANASQDLWQQPPAPGEANLLMQTASSLSQWNTGLSNQIEVVVLADTPSLRWAFRDWPLARFQTSISTQDQPPVLITYKDQSTPSLQATYRGEAFAWEVYPDWQGVAPADFPLWLVFRQAPVRSTQVILWARLDLFPGGAASSTGSSPGPQVAPVPPGN